MIDPIPLATATTGYLEAPDDWTPASQVGPLIFEDPAIIWLEYHGAQHGFLPDSTPYLDFIAGKSHQFEHKWLQEMAPEAVRVCQIPGEARYADKVRQTVELMRRGVPVIAQPALWWAPECIYGVPDLIALASWLGEKFPGCIDKTSPGQPDHYVVLDLKFTTKLEESQKSKDLANYSAQLRLYSYVLGQLQGVMPRWAYLITRDRVASPLPVEIISDLDRPLDADLASLRDQYIEIRVRGAQYVPWKDAIVAANLANPDERWRSAKEVICRERIPGGDAGLLYQVGSKVKAELIALGYPNLEALLQADPGDIPFEKCKGVGSKKASQIRAVLIANRTGLPILPPLALIPSVKTFEFVVDYEYFTNINVDFDRQWPTLEGREMIFMIGIGFEEKGAWCFERFPAGAEDIIHERDIFEAFIAFLDARTLGAFTDPTQTAIYHWSSAEVWQTQRLAERHQLALDHPLRKLPWVNLQKVFTESSAALPGAWDFGLKTIAGALGELEPDFMSQWPEGCAEGQQAMLMGWKAYQMADSLKTHELAKVAEYLEVDCRAVWNILGWLRSLI